MTDTNNSPLEGNVLFYTNPEPLDQSVHGGLGVNPSDKPYAFVAQTNIVPLTVTEFSAAALSYPIIFTGDNRQPVAVMGLSSNENLFVAPDGEFRADAYVPAYVRRYPFVFADDKQNQRLILCIDRGASIVAEGGQNPLFVDGQPSDYTNMAMEFCNNFEQERQRTEGFVALVKDLDLLDVREAHFTPRNPDGTPGQPQKLAEYYAVSEDKLRALPAEKLVELRDNGALGQIYAHLVSLVGWDRLIAMAVMRQAQAPTSVN
ncbi:SapC family protein [Brevundimonas fontaquae]|uniref:SapC family protein n=1 Tax=Brevundimonas fontaquae TaxID=2813778 RepID=A0ABX7LNE8_9CAUL|nr:SapC family protein [Brevundimonas fontaquae]QSF54364.1 SapC family protein [Brevundimonas fontaquae]